MYFGGGLKPIEIDARRSNVKVCGGHFNGVFEVSGDFLSCFKMDLLHIWPKYVFWWGIEAY